MTKSRSGPRESPGGGEGGRTCLLATHTDSHACTHAHARTYAHTHTHTHTHTTEEPKGAEDTCSEDHREMDQF